MGNPIRNTAGELLANGVALQIRDITREIVRLSAPANQLSTITTAAAVRVKDQYKFDIQTMAARPNTVTVVAVGADANAGKITVSAADLGWIQVGMNLRKDGDIAPRVTAVDYAAATYQVTVATTGMAAGTVLYLGAASSAEGSAAPMPITRIPDVVQQYIGTIRCAYGISRMAASSANYSGIREFQTRKECLDYMKEMLERSCWFDALEEIVGPPYQLKPGGLVYVATEAGNVWPFEDDIFSLDGMAQAVRHITRWMPSKKLMWMVSPKGGEYLNRIGINKTIPNTHVEIPELGLACDSYKFGKKELMLHIVDQLDGGALENEMFVTDPAGIAAATTKNQQSGKRNWMLEETDAQTPGTDGSLGVFTCDFGPDFVPQFCWRLTGAENFRV